MLEHNIGNKFDDGGRNYKICWLAACDDLFGRLEELVGWLAIHEATAVAILTAAMVCRREF